MTIKDIEDRLTGGWYGSRANADIRLLLDVAKAAQEYLDSQTVNGRITPPYHKSSGRLAAALDALEQAQ